MTDKELIELAAKAAGLHVKVASNSGRGLKVHGNCNWWNPLTDDGDALRLADHLDLIVDFSRFAAIQADRFYLGHRDFAIGNNVNEAITRAAAQIGKEME